MASPFPGMDPYLEGAELWPAFHHQLIMCLYQILVPAIADRYKARVGQRRYTGEREVQEEYIEIRERNEAHIVTLIDVATPTNKTTAAGRQAYMAKRREGHGPRANLGAVDLARRGKALIEYSRAGRPARDDAVTVTRATAPARH